MSDSDKPGRSIPAIFAVVIVARLALAESISYHYWLLTMKRTGFLGIASLSLSLLLSCQIPESDSYDLAGIASVIEGCDGLGDFHNGLAFVVKDGKVGFIDKAGRVVVPFDYSGPAEYLGDGVVRVRKGGETVYVGPSGKELFKSSADIGKFSEGLARIYDGNFLAGFVDKTGRLVIPCKFESVGTFKEGLCWVTLPEDPKRVGFIDATGALVIPCGYSISAEGRPHADFSDGLCLVSGGGQGNDYFIDASGKKAFDIGGDIIPCGGFSEGLAAVLWNDGGGVFKSAYIDKSGRPVITLSKGVGEDFHYGIAPVTSEDGTVFVNKEGTVVGGLPKGRTAAKYTGEGTWLIQSEDYKSGYFSSEIKSIIPCEYDSECDFSEGLVRVCDASSGKWGYADRNGKTTFDYQATGTPLPDADGIYEARIVNGEVYLDFDDEAFGRYTRDVLGKNGLQSPGRNRKVEGLKGACAELMKCVAGEGGESYDGIGQPYLAMRTDDGRVYVLSVLEAVEGDMLCGPVPNVDGAVALTTEYDAANGLFPAARLSDGTDWVFGGWWLWGYYVMEDYDFVIHLSRDYCISLDKRPPHEYHNSGIFFQSWAGSGIIQLSTDLADGSMTISMREDPETWSFNVDDVVDNPSIPILCGEYIRTARLFEDPWKSGYIKAD